MCLVCVTQNAVTVAWPQLELLTSLISHEYRYTGWISHFTFVATFHNLLAASCKMTERMATAQQHNSCTVLSPPLFNTGSSSCSCHGFSFAFHHHCLASFDLYCHDHRLLQPFFRRALGLWLFSCFFVHFYFWNIPSFSFCLAIET